VNNTAPQTKTKIKTKTATPKASRIEAAKPLPRVLPSDITPAHRASVARSNARLDAWRLAGGAYYEGPIEGATMAQVLASAFGRIESDPVRDGLNALCGELDMLSAAMEAAGASDRVDVGLYAYRLARRAEALAELHARMLERALDHVERLALEAET